LYILNNDGVNIYNSEGRLQKRINDNGLFAVSPQDKYLVCVSENIAKVYDNFDYSFQVKLNSPAIRRVIFSTDNQYLGVMARNEFTFVSLESKQILWTKDFPEPLIFSKIVDDKIILVTEDHSYLVGRVYLFSLTGEMLGDFNFHYQQYDEQIQNIEILPDGIKAKTHLREWELGKSEQEQNIYATTDFTDSHRFFSNSFNQFNRWLYQDTIPWPLPSTNSFHCLGNNWGEYQNYSSGTTSSYFHPGIDIITPD
jgi:hypothetical protein